MYTTYHLSSAQEVNSDILDAIKVAFKSRPIVITIEEEEQDFEISQEMKNILDERLLEDESDYITADESIKQLKDKYGL
ncbi:MAG: hypothetical protein RLZZ312_363 [Bacteroidota bacterium]|jgi:CRISPR/Cas system-associated exonuclease Cas4 (RecB family)